jgi:menaquinone-dependent protoporphyrinogen oxidase
MSVLVTYASKHGSTREIADHIAERLRVNVADVRVLPVEEAPTILEPEYSAVVIGSPVYAGSWMRPASHYLKRAKPPKHAWAFSVGMADGEAKVKEAMEMEKVVRALWPELHGHQLFRGRFEEKAQPWWLRLCLCCVPERSFNRGDVRNWDVILSWADEVAVELRAAGVGN